MHIAFPGLLLALLGLAAAAPHLGEVFTLKYPESWPQPVYDFQKNPLTKEGVALGRKLFYDPILSRDSTISCSSCHLSYTAFTHVDHALSHGIHDSIGTRNSPALVNLAWSWSFMWDGAVNHLDVQALAPITHPAEMGEDLAHVVEKLQATESYPNLFAGVYGDEKITGERLLKALAQFQLTLVSCNSKYDQVMRGEPGIEFSEQEKRGYELFKLNCASCHAEPLFTNGEFYHTGLPMDSLLQDEGRFNLTLDERDWRAFKVPSLRNIEFSYPYMHDGRFKKLYQVLNHYTTIRPGVSNLPYYKFAKGGISLDERGKVDVIAFLLTLTDREFLFNPEFAFPKE
ncbi:MAG: cytochrome-c peroxidase [Bacteroidia bacterium]|nr:cytochrome-c peroxidase [Bacteroidia bacterium]